MTMNADQLLDQLDSSGAELQVLPDRSLRCTSIPPELVSELKRLQLVVVHILLGELEGPRPGENPSSTACTNRGCRHEKMQHYPAAIWTCAKCDCSQWRKKPGPAGIRMVNQGDEQDVFWSEYKICRCGHDDVDHVKNETGMTVCMVKAGTVCGCPAYQKPMVKKAKARRFE